MTAPVIVAITGAAGKVGYDLAFRVAQGDLLGPDTPVELRLLDIPDTLDELEGRAMEVHDCAFPTLAHIEIGADPRAMFERANIALLVAGKPRKPGSSRADLIGTNGALFAEHGRALGEVAAPDIRALVTGNPANTNCAIAASHAPDIPRTRFAALTRLDHDRAKHRLAKRLKVGVAAVTQMSVWGNHSSTLYPDVFHALVDGESAWDRIDDMDWLVNKYIPAVAERGATIIAKRGTSSVASASNATVAAMHDWCLGTRTGDWVSLGVASDGAYGVPDHLYSSFPVTIDATGEYTIVTGLQHNDFAQARIHMSVSEMASEYAAVAAMGLLGKR